MTENNYNPDALPDVHDEAPDTASWVPVLGVMLALALLTAVALVASRGAERAGTHNKESKTDGN